METDQEQTLITEISADGARGPDTLMEQLRAKRQELSESRDTFIRLPGYEDVGLQAKYRLIERAEVEIIGKRVQRETKDRSERNVRILFDLIIAATMGFYWEQSDSDGPQPLMLVDEEVQITRWDQLADYMGQAQPNARAALMYVFAENEWAVGQHGILLNRWMSNTGLEVDEEFLGEGV